MSTYKWLEWFSKIIENQKKLLAEKEEKFDDYCNDDDGEKYGNKNNKNQTNATVP